MKGQRNRGVEGKFSGNEIKRAKPDIEGTAPLTGEMGGKA
jgi:hypothetical protein